MGLLEPISVGLGANPTMQTEPWPSPKCPNPACSAVSWPLPDIEKMK